MTELEVSLNNFWVINSWKRREKKREKEKQGGGGKGQVSGSFYPTQTLNLGALCTFLFLIDRTPGIYQLTHNLCLNCVERVECAQFGNHAFFTFTTYVCVCAQLCITDSSACFAPFTLASFKLHFPSPDICCLSLLLQNIMIWWELCKSIFSAWDTHFSPNSLKTAEISTSVNSFQVWPLGN